MAHRATSYVIGFLVASALIGCNDRDPRRAQPAAPPPFSVNMGSVATSFVNGRDVPLMRLTIRNTSTRPFTLTRMHCNLDCRNSDLRVQYDLYANGRRVSSNPVALMPGVPFDLYFAGEIVQPGATVDVRAVANITGMRNGDTLILIEDFIGTETEGNDTFTRQSDAVIYVDQANSLIR